MAAGIKTTACLDNAVILFDKPTGITSNDALNSIKRLTGVKKMGHSGTLDRFASGLLVICTGCYTRLARYFLDGDKSYEGVIRLGISTDTDDIDGRVIEEKRDAFADEEDILKTAGSFRGNIFQVPPVYSALKFNGVRASDLARKGREVIPEGRMVNISLFEVAGIDRNAGTVSIRVTCSKGTYIRSIARDMGRMLGTGGCLAGLRRTGSGCFSVEDAATMRDLTGLQEGNSPKKKFIIGPGEAMSQYGSIIVKHSAREKVLNGARFEREDVAEITGGGEKIHAVLDQEKNLIAIAEADIEKWEISYQCVFNQR
ncbi:MAG: tRNA pseudouridine(55) synthase TruB [Spirochaetes bacterium]|jgi:tRNA pseudouridine55 synthase|nr:tRNA pseudouridine(55) synthase TruB [Spirochaetota bacterium]